MYLINLYIHVNSVPQVVKINNALLRADQIQSVNGIENKKII
jgi:isocitrate lyase